GTEAQGFFWELSNLGTTIPAVADRAKESRAEYDQPHEAAVNWQTAWALPAPANGASLGRRQWRGAARNGCLTRVPPVRMGPLYWCRCRWAGRMASGRLSVIRVNSEGERHFISRPSFPTRTWAYGGRITTA